MEKKLRGHARLMNRQTLVKSKSRRNQEGMIFGVIINQQSSAEEP